MNDIDTLFKKNSKKERQFLSELIDALAHGEKNVIKNAKKLKGHDLYRVRHGVFRVIFSFDSMNNIVIEYVGKRSENTYKNLG